MDEESSSDEEDSEDELGAAPPVAIGKPVVAVGKFLVFVSH